MPISVVTDKELSKDNPYAQFASGEVNKSNPYYTYARSLEQQVEDDTQANMEAVVQDVEENGTLQDTMMGVRAFLDGTLFGFADEAASAISSVALKTFWPDLFADKSISELNQEIVTELETERFAWEQENPKTALGLNVVGGVLSPANIVGVGVIQKAQQARQAVKAAETGVQVQRATTLGSAAPSVIGASEKAAAESLKLAQQYSGMSPAIFNIVSKTPTLGITAGVGAVEGAVAGAGFAAQGEKTRGAAVGATLGAAAPVVLKGAGLMANEISKTRLAQPLGKGKDFVSIMFTESGVAGFYRTILSKPFLSKSLMEQQARVTSGKVLLRASEAKQQLANVTNRATQALSSAKKNIERNARSEVAKIASQKEDTLFQLSKEAGKEHKDLVTASAREVEDFKISQVGSKEEAEAAVLRQIDAETNVSNAAFLSASRMEGMPTNATKADREAIQQLDPQEAISYLDSVWRAKGFSAAKNKQYSIKPESVIAKVESILEKDTRAYLALKQSSSPTLAQDIITRTLSKEVKDGKISGEALVNLRSEVGVILNGITENKALVREAVDEIQDFLDELIMKQLTPKQKASFMEDKYRYATKNVVENATYKAVGRKGAIEGAYTADDWLSALKQNNKYFATRGKSPLQKEAAQVSYNNVQRDSILKAEADKLLKENIKTGIKDAGILKRELDKQLDIIKQTEKQAIKDARRSFATSKRTVEDRAVLDTRLAEIKSQHETQLNILNGQQKQLKSQVDFLKENSPKSQVSFFEQDYSASQIGRILTNTVFGLKTQILGNTLSLGLASETAQRAFAGQTATQEAMRQITKQLERGGQAASRAGLDVTTAGAISGAQAAKDTKPMFSPEAKKAIINGGRKRMLAVYQGLEDRGQLEKLKVQDIDLYNKLKAVAGE